MTRQPKTTARHSALGKQTHYVSHYDPSTLFAIARKAKRDELGIPADKLPFAGFDCWNHYEVSWLNEKGKPVVAVAEMRYGCDSPYIIESKSLKLYFNSLNNTRFKDVATVTAALKKDLAAKIEAPVSVTIIPLPQFSTTKLYRSFTGICLDELDIECTVYTVEPAFLTTENAHVTETLYSDLLKSNCLVTHQPDWGSVQISYTGNKINHAGLLRYLVSFRNHNEFHEQCIERIFMDIMRRCQPQTLAVYGRYTRRGGIDINPYRATHPAPLPPNDRLCRQ